MQSSLIDECSFRNETLEIYYCFKRKLLKLSNLLFSVHIVEALNTRVIINCSDTWASTFVGSGEVDSIQLALTITKITVGDYTGFNLSFATEQDGMSIEEFQKNLLNKL